MSGSRPPPLIDDRWPWVRVSIVDGVDRPRPRLRPESQGALDPVERLIGPAEHVETGGEILWRSLDERVPQDQPVEVDGDWVGPQCTVAVAELDAGHPHDVDHLLGDEPVADGRRVHSVEGE